MFQVHVLLHNSLKPSEKPQEKTADDKQMAMLQQRIAQLTETNMTLKTEIDRLKYVSRCFCIGNMSRWNTICLRHCYRRCHSRIGLLAKGASSKIRLTNRAAVSIIVLDVGGHS